jgi:hypothetical protein
MKANLVAVIALGMAVLFQTGCTKAAPEQTKAERIKEIDAQLKSWVSTGRPEDAQRRVALKAERALLAANLGYPTSTETRVFSPATTATPVQVTTTPIIAPDGARTENRWHSMDGGAGWMDTTKQTPLHNHTIYSPGYGGYYTYPNGGQTYTNPRP